MNIKNLLAGAALTFALPAMATAQLGGLVRKAKDVAANKVETKVVANKNLKPSSAFGPELTAESLDGVLRGLAAADAKLDEADQLRTARQQADAEFAKSTNAHDKDREAYDALARKTESCQENVIRTRGKDAQAAYMQRMQGNPAAQAEMIQAAMAVTRKANAAQQKGDTLEVRRLMADLAKAQGIDPKADTLAAIKSCGAVPEKPSWLAEQESLRARSTRLDGQVRNAESAAQSSAAAASGMSARDYAMARERVLHWSIEARGGSPIQAFGGDERKLLQSKRSDIEKHRRALEGGA